MGNDDGSTSTALPSAAARDAGRPIVILGISQRSGTNFLARLIQRHPDCATPAPPVKEDFLLTRAGMLVRYAERTSALWPRRWGDREAGRSAILTGLGKGLLAFLVDTAGGGRPVTKTPSVRNLHLAPRLLSGADVVVLVRDGRAVTESLHHGYRWSYTRSARTWRAGARRILAFQSDAGAQGDLRWTLVRYEDLVLDARPTLTALFDFLGLDTGRYDFEAAEQFPVTGSSFVRTDDGGIQWEPTERPAEFDPNERHRTWPVGTRERFRWIAGAEQAALGYPLDDPARPRWWWSARNLALDAGRPVIYLRELAMELRRRIRLALQALEHRRTVDDRDGDGDARG